MNIGVLYIIATPIGNLGDISQRALDTLTQVDLIGAEDTRHSKKLLQHFQIDTPMVSLHADNEEKAAKKLIGQIQEGKSVALISDAGTPLVSDPGRFVVQAAHDAGISVIPIPGACAVVAALSVSGFAADQFLFLGFLSTQAGAREKKLATLKNEPRTMIFYEAPHRITKFIDELILAFGEQREVVIAREITKQFETIKRAELKEIKSWMQADANQQKGEFVVIIKGSDAIADINIEFAEKTLGILMNELTLKQAVKLTAEITGIKKNTVYDMALKRQNT